MEGGRGWSVITDIILFSNNINRPNKLHCAHCEENVAKNAQNRKKNIRDFDLMVLFKYRSFSSYKVYHLLGRDLRDSVLICLKCKHNILLN